MKKLADFWSMGCAALGLVVALFLAAFRSPFDE